MQVCGVRQCKRQCVDGEDLFNYDVLLERGQKFLSDKDILPPVNPTGRVLTLTLFK